MTGQKEIIHLPHAKRPLDPDMQIVLAAGESVTLEIETEMTEEVTSLQE